VKPASGSGLRGVDFDLNALIGLRFAAATLDLGSGAGAREPLAGRHRTRIRGRGIDYAETRAYMPGDDIRAMDWRVTARTGVPHSKLFREERERPLLLVVDLGPTMRFGTRRAFKSVVAAEAAGLVAWAALGHGDRVGAIAFAGVARHESRPAGARRGVLHALQAVATCGAAPAQPAPQALAEVLARARSALRPGGLMVVISDFYGLDAVAERRLARIATRCDLACMQVYDPLECEAPPRGRYAVTDGLRRALLDVRSDETRTRYADGFDARRRRLERACHAHGVLLVTLRCGDPVAETLRNALLLGPRNQRVTA